MEKKSLNVILETQYIKPIDILLSADRISQTVSLFNNYERDRAYSSEANKTLSKDPPGIVTKGNNLKVVAEQ